MIVGMALLAQTKGYIHPGQVNLPLTCAFGGHQDSKLSRDLSKNGRTAAPDAQKMRPWKFDALHPVSAVLCDC